MTKTITPPEKPTDSAAITLSEPIQRGEQEIAEITLRRPKGGELRGLNIKELFGGEYDAVRTLVPRIAVPQILPSDIDAMPAQDVFEITGTIMGFFMSPEQMATVLAQAGIETPALSTG